MAANENGVAGDARMESAQAWGAPPGPGATSSGPGASLPGPKDIPPVPGASPVPESTKVPESTPALETTSAALRTETVLSRPYRALTSGIVSVVLLIAFEATAVGTAMPVAADELNGISLYAFAFSAFFTTSIVGMVGSGQWCDRRGPLPPLATGIVGFAAGLVLSGTAATMWIFVLGRAVQGVGGGLVIVALYVTVSRAFPERLRPTVMAAFAASWVVPSVVGPLISGTVTEHLGWRWVFLGIPVLVVLPLVVMLPPLRRAASGPPEGAKPPGPADRRRVRLAVAVALGAALLQYAGQDLRWIAVVPAALGAALLVPSVRALLPRGTVRAARGLPAVVLLRGMAAGAYVVAESFIPLMLVTQRGLSVTMAGLTLAAGGAFWALGSFAQSRPRLEPQRERLVRTGMVLVTFAIAYSPLVLVHSVPVWTLALAMALGCLGMGMVISSLSVLLLRLSAPEEAGRNSAALQLCDGLSNVLLLALTGAVFAALGGGAVSVGAGAHGGGAGVADGARPGAFVAVYAVSAVVALAGVGVAGRIRK
ncbi:MFS transporter [Streptomyces axinellae]|uniref:MFS transporter n=1 Tax=Streptomyces axinellae TaxID=552788 RepID=UPI0031D822A1